MEPIQSAVNPEKSGLGRDLYVESFPRGLSNRDLPGYSYVVRYLFNHNKSIVANCKCRKVIWRILCVEAFTWWKSYVEEFTWRALCCANTRTTLESTWNSRDTRRMVLGGGTYVEGPPWKLIGVDSEAPLGWWLHNRERSSVSIDFWNIMYLRLI